jgi:hypothetical protein
MASLTLTEMQRLSTESLTAGVIDEIINRDPITPRIPFRDFQGTQLTYVRESTVPTGQFYDVDETIVEGTPTTTQVNVSVKSIGLHADTPGFYDTLENVNAIRAYYIRGAAKGVMETVADKVVYGNSSSSSKEFNGVHALLPAAQVVEEGTGGAGTGLNMANLDDAIHRVRNGNIDVITMTRALHRRFSGFVNFSSTNTPIQTGRNEFGQFITTYGNYPIAFNDFQTQTEAVSGTSYSAKTGGNTSSLFLLQFGDESSDKPGIFGIQGPGGMEVMPKGWVEDKDNYRDFIRWRLALGLGSTKSVAAVTGVTDAAIAA